MMRDGYVGKGTRRLHYQQWGSGPQLIFAFHGYGNNAGIYGVLANHLSSEYTLISIDLPFHGRSDWKGEAPLSKAELMAMIEELRGGNRQKIVLSGFSLGGRIALTLVEQIPEQIAAVYLAAPDGLVPNPVYHFVTKNAIGRRLFQSMIREPKKHLQLIAWFRSRGWIDASRQQFVEYFLGSKHSREFLGDAWPAVQELVPSIAKARATIGAQQIPVHLFMGKWDKVIPPKNAISFAKDSATITVHTLDKGHRVLDDETARIIAKMLPRQ